jgi:hypothetical protein
MKLENLEKTALKSKKFIAWLISEVFLAGMAVSALVTQPELGWPLASYMVGIVFTMGCATMWYLGKQAAIDTFQRGFNFNEKKTEE